ncbi:hypothetical protein AAG906_012653 [Vitis piasezkii]
MSTPSRSRSLAMGSENYFNWRESMEKHQHESKSQISPVMNKKYSLRKDPRQPAMRSRMRAPTPLASQQKGDAIGSPWPQMPGAKRKPHVATAQEACPGLSTTPAITDWRPHPPVQQPVGDLVNRGPPALSSSDWTTCYPCLSALTSSTTILQEGSWS